MATSPDEAKRRVLTILGRFARDPETQQPRQRWSLVELTQEYNKVFPPGLLRRKVSEKTVKEWVDALVSSEHISHEVLTFTHKPIRPTKFYKITNKGLQAIAHRKGK